MSGDSKLTIVMAAMPLDPQRASEFAEELSWEHTSSQADNGWYERGDDAFASAYRSYRGRYERALEHSGHLQSVAISAVIGLLTDGGLAIPSDTKADEVMGKLNDCASIVSSAMLWAIASAGISLIPDTEWRLLPDDDITAIIGIKLDTLPEVPEQ